VKQWQAKPHQVLARHGLEKVNLDLGFIPLAACAPMAVAEAKGFFAKHGLDEVQLVRETSWRGITDGLLDRTLDGALMPSGMPTWMTAGGHGGDPTPIVTALTLSRNGNGITLASRLAELGVNSVADYRDYLLRNNREPHTLGIVHPASMHNLLLRYWLASNAIDPDHDVKLQNLPPAQMLADLKDGSIDGYCVGEPMECAGRPRRPRLPDRGRHRDLVWPPRQGARRARGLGPGLPQHAHRPHEGTAGGLPLLRRSQPLG